MISFERTLRLVTSVQVLACLFFFSLFTPTVALLINGMFAEAGVAAILTVCFVFALGALVDSIPDTPFVTLVLLSEFVASGICGLMINFTTTGALIIFQVIIFVVVTSETITEINNDVCTVLEHKDKLFGECERVEDYRKNPTDN